MMLPGALPELRSGTMRVELDKKALFALASDTRIEILRALQPMRRTVTQLAEALDVDKAAVHRHLQKLVEGELVRRYEDHGFVYYGLSWKARDLLAPNANTRVVVHIAAFFWAVLGVVAAAALALGSRVLTAYDFATGGSGNQPGVAAGGPESGRDAGFLVGITSSTSLLWPILAVVLAALAGVLVFLAWRAHRGPRQRAGAGEAPEASAPGRA